MFCGIPEFAGTRAIVLIDERSRLVLDSVTIGLRIRPVIGICCRKWDKWDLRSVQ